VPFSLLRKLFPLGLLGVSAVLAQNPADLFSKAPPEVEEALRARIAIFFQAHVDGKPRRAEEVIAEDSMDYFYNGKKPKFLSFEIGKIKYSKEFTEAVAVVVVETFVPMVGFAGKPMKVPTTTMWKVVDGKWYWYLTEDIINTTPFGKMGGSSGGKPAQGGSATLPDLKNAPSPESLAQRVKADKAAVELKTASPSSDQVTIQNRMPGTVTLELRSPTIDGLEVKLDRTQVSAGEKAVVSFRYVPGKNSPPGSALVEVMAQPVNTLIPVQVNFR
jgi:hypothetical protein